MNIAVRKLLGQAIIRYIAGDKVKAAELSSKAQELSDRRQHLQVPVKEILIHKGYNIG